MRVVITGGSGAVGASVIKALSSAGQVDEIVGVDSRYSDWGKLKLRWEIADAVDDKLGGIFRGADVVVHLAWSLQPGHNPVQTWRNNVLGGISVFDTVARERVPALVHASSVGAYSPGPADSRVSESWPTHGWAGAAYTREKAYLERYLDAFECRNPQVRVVRMRPGFILKPKSPPRRHRLFARLWSPDSQARARSSVFPVLPDLPGLRAQVVHADDAAEAYRLAILSDARGPFNIAAEPVINASVLAELFGARTVPVPRGALRGPLTAAWKAHVMSVSPGLFDAMLHLPLMDTTRAREELGWTPRHSATDTVEGLVGGFRWVALRKLAGNDTRHDASVP